MRASPRLPPERMRWLIVGTLIVLWEVLPRSGLVAELFLPPLSKTIAVGVADWREYAGNLVVTLGEIAVAVVFACGGGILVGAFVGGFALSRNLLLPIFSTLYAVPIVILYPIFTAWLGIGPQSKIAFAAVYGFFPTMLGTASGIRTIDPQLLLAARSMGASTRQRIMWVIIPASIPTVLAGLRLGGALVIVGVVVSEMLISTAGIGYLVTRYRTVLDSAHVFAGVLLIVLLTVLFSALVRLVERRTAVWQAAGRRQAREPDEPVAIAAVVVA
jgi:NitT/TauT family transport system permease protein